MDLTQDKPPLADVFRPQRQNLNEQNEYLCNVGLLVLIRGFPTPDLPQLVTTKMMEVHGGLPTNYVVTQATVTPFIITCPNTRIRDVIVRGGIYTIPQLEVQFKIHEWRPRFGFRYDPPTHQVWIKLVGLPLQAWTQQEVTAIIQQFGYPLQILPFDQAAGHHRDISALIATMHPTRIPLAGRYREGDYSTQFDVVILSWRLWDDEHFPPPDNPIPQQDPAHQIHQQNNQLAAASNSSSSSSTKSRKKKMAPPQCNKAPLPHPPQGISLSPSEGDPSTTLLLLGKFHASSQKIPPPRANPKETLCAKSLTPCPLHLPSS